MQLPNAPPVLQASLVLLAVPQATGFPALSISTVLKAPQLELTVLPSPTLEEQPDSEAFKNVLT